MFCQHCGAQAPEDARICPSCGAALGAASLGAGQPWAPGLGIEVNWVRWNRWIKQGWNLVTDNLGLFIGAALVQVVLQALSQAALKFGLGTGQNTSSWSFGPRDYVAITPLSVIQGPLLVGAFIICILKLAGRDASVGDLFGGFRFFWQAVAASIAIDAIGSLPALAVSLVTRNLSVGWALLSVIPCILITVLFAFAFLFLADKRMGFWTAMRSSAALVSADYFGFLGFLVMLVLINILGGICCFVGVLVSMPVSMVALTAAYREFVGFDERNLETL